MSIKLQISTDLDIPPSMIDEAMAVARIHVKKLYITKRNGDVRVIYQPSKKLKTIQYWLMINVFKKLAIHESAVAYRDGLSILHNAKIHRNNKYFLKMDFKNFFPSIKWIDLKPLLIKWHGASEVSWPLNEEALNFIRMSCFYKNDVLPIGYPSSPIISNIVMLSTDVEITKLVSDDEEYGNVVYTRYADDIVLSTNKKGACAALLTAISEIVRKTKSPNISVNKDKTKIASSSGGSASVTGLRICADGHITIHRKQKDHIRLLLSLYRKEVLDANEHESLLGHLAYIHHVAPDFYSKLQKKYFMEIAELRAKNV